jgi:hypothetical protein
VQLEPRIAEQGEGWQSGPESGPAIGVHPRGRGPGDTFSLAYFQVDDMAGALESVTALGGTVIHTGESWAVCKDSGGTPFGLGDPAPRAGLHSATDARPTGFEPVAFGSVDRRSPQG